MERKIILVQAKNSKLTVEMDFFRKFLICQIVLMTLIARASSVETCHHVNFCCEKISSEYKCSIRNIALGIGAGLNYNYFFNYYTRSYINEIRFVNVTMPKFNVAFFDNFNYLKRLNGSGIQLEEVERDVFKSASSLKSLNLSSNKISSLGNLLFHYLPALQNLDLSKNQISSMKSGTFDDSSLYLTFVDLSQNQLKTIPLEFFVIMIGETWIDLSSNQIEDIGTQENTTKELKFISVNLSNNKLGSFDFKISEVQKLNLSRNNLQGKMSFRNQTITNLDVSYNNLEQLDIDFVQSLNVSENLLLKEVSLPNLTELTDLRMRNVNLSNLTGIQLVNHASELNILDLSFSYVGPLKIDDFADLTSLKELYLKKTGISRLTFGTFSHQKNLNVLDISDNALGSIDLHMLSGMLALNVLDISGNNLVKLDIYDSLHEFFPLEEIGLDNTWNCTYLAKMFKSLNAQGIRVKDPTNFVTNSSNILGFQCTTTATTPLIKITSGSDDQITAKLNEIVEELNEEKTNRNNFKLDIDVLKSEIFNLKNENLELKSQITKIQLSAANSTPNNSNAGSNEIRLMVEQLNSMTLEKQKLANDQLLFKINELQL